MAEDDDTARNLVVLCVALVLLLGCLMGLIIVQVGASGWHIAEMAAFGRYLWLLPIGFVAAGVYQAFSYWAVRQGAFARLAKTKVHQSTLMVATQISLGFLGLGALGLVLGYMASQAAGIRVLAAPFWRDRSEQSRQVTMPRLLAAVHRYRRFPLISGWSSLLNGAGLQVLPIMLIVLYGSQVGGWLGFGQRVFAVPLSVLGQSVGQVYLSEASRLARNEPVGLLRLFYRTIGQLMLIGCTLCLVVVLFAPTAFALVFGEDWFGAGQFVQVLAPMFAAQLVTVPVSQTLNVLERQDLQLVWDAVRLILNAGALLLAGSFHLSPLQAVGLFSVTATCAYIGLLMMIASQLRWRARNLGATTNP